MTNPKQRAALAYAARGWRVFPLLAVSQAGGCECAAGAACDRAGKHPAIEEWPTRATTDKAQINEWWTSRPDRGIGIATGAESDLTVLDVDGDEGVDELGNLAGAEGLPPTPASSSRPGRFHYYFRFNPAIKSKSKNIGAHLDTRSEGGYVVAPPSRHATGSEYQWIVRPEKAEVAPWPSFLAEGGRKATKRKTARAERPDPAKLKAALAYIDADDEERWCKVGWILGRAFKQSDEGFALFSAWAARSRKYDQKRTKGHYYSRSKERDDGPTVETIYGWASQEGWTWDGDVELHPGAPHETVDTCSEVLGAVGVFSRAGELVTFRRVSETPRMPDDEIRRAPSQVLIVPLGPEAIRLQLHRLKTFTRAGKAVDLPYGLAKMIAAAGEWKGIAELRGFVNAPTMRADGSIAQAPGYDPASQLYLNIDSEWPKVPDHPSKAQAQKALAELMMPFDQFTFEDDAARASFVAALLTAAVRHTLPAAPAVYIIAPTPGSGKTLLADAIATICEGHVAAKRMFPKDDDAEMRKVLTSAIRAGDSTIVFDNVPRAYCVKSPVMDGAVTSNVWADRVLGRSEQVTLPFTMNVLFTGNNITCGGDSVRRSIFVHLDPQCELPETRKFKIPDLLSHLRGHRRALLVATLTILRAYVAAVDRVNVSPLGSFERWTSVVREAVVWLGMRDPVDTQARMRVADEDRDETSEALRALTGWAPPDDSWFKAADVASEAARNPTFKAAVCPSSDSTAKAITHVLKGMARQRIDGRWLTSRYNPHSKTIEYRIEEAP